MLKPFQNLKKASRDAIWFVRSQSKRIELSKAVHSGDKAAIRKAANRALDSISCEKTKKQLKEALKSN